MKMPYKEKLESFEKYASPLIELARRRTEHWVYAPMMEDILSELKSSESFYNSELKALEGIYKIGKVLEGDTGDFEYFAKKKLEQTIEEFGREVGKPNNIKIFPTSNKLDPMLQMVFINSLRKKINDWLSSK